MFTQPFIATIEGWTDRQTDGRQAFGRDVRKNGSGIQKLICGGFRQRDAVTGPLIVFQNTEISLKKDPAILT
jgi:hypothetical protein